MTETGTFGTNALEKKLNEKPGSKKQTKQSVALVQTEPLAPSPIDFSSVARLKELQTHYHGCAHDTMQRSTTARGTFEGDADLSGALKGGCVHFDRVKWHECGRTEYSTTRTTPAQPAAFKPKRGLLHNELSAPDASRANLMNDKMGKGGIHAFLLPGE